MAALPETEDTRRQAFVPVAMTEVPSGVIGSGRRLRTPICMAVGAVLVLMIQAAMAAPDASIPEGGEATPTSGTTPQQPADPPSDGSAPPALPTDEQWAIHGQTTFVDQYHPAFASAYRGPNSLDPGSRGNETWDVTLYAGYRPWRGAEIWIDPEVDQGFGLSDTLGLAGFSSAEAYKVGAATPYVRLQRVFLRQILDLGGSVQGVDPDINQLGGSQTANRVEVTVGKFSVADIFDANTYAHDPRNDFLNWTVVDGGAFDYAADSWGYTVGAAAEWYQDWWTLRGGVFDGSITPNSEYLDERPGQQFQAIVEGEARYGLYGQTGKVRLLGYQTRALLATYSELESFFEENPNATNPDTESVRHLRNRYGGEINIEQQITVDLDIFLRASTSSDNVEPYEFTDVDRSLLGGLSLAGKRWNRPDDMVGAAFVVNNIGKAHKEYFEQGDLGLLIGDGKLSNAGPEQIFEAYYSHAVLKGVNVSVDYQLVNHPAYNVDRGPVHILGVRLHAQF